MKSVLLSTLKFSAVFLAVFLAISPSVSAEDDEDVILGDMSNIFDFKALGGMDSRLAPYGDDLMGDMIDKNTGGITFEHTDVSLPGNSSLEVAFRRKKGQGAVPYSPFQHGFGDWVIDLPLAHISYAPGNLSSPQPVFNNGCLTSYGSMSSSANVGAHFGSTSVSPDTHTSGTILRVPGKGLSGYPGDLKTPADPKSDWTSGPRTTDFAGRCATLTIAPDGTKYKFGRHVIRQAKYLPVPYEYMQCSGDMCGRETAEFSLYRRSAVYLITEVEDVNGNWVRYDYTNNSRAELTRIYSNDGRDIRVHYASGIPNPLGRNSRRVTHVTANGRTWTYGYTGSSNPPPPPPPPQPQPPFPDPNDPCNFFAPAKGSATGAELFNCSFPGNPVASRNDFYNQVIVPNQRKTYLQKLFATTNKFPDNIDIKTLDADFAASTGQYETFRSLDKVTLPDGRFWKFGDGSGLRGIQFEVHRYYKCLPYDVTFDMKHPDGAIGTFRLRETRHIKGASWLGDTSGDNITHYMKPMTIPRATNNSECNGTYYPWGQVKERPWDRTVGWPIYRTMSVASKSISGAGLPESKWEFEYRNYTGGALDNNWTKVTGPDGTKTTYTHQAVGTQHGLLRTIDVVPQSGSGETIAYEHNQSDGGAPGGTYGSCRADGGDLSVNVPGLCVAFNKRPVTKEVHKRDGDTYTTEYVYSFGSTLASYASGPTSVKKYSNVSTTPRIISTAYEHKSSKWILSLPKTVTRGDGVQIASFVYDSLGRKTSQKRYGKPHATFGYHTNTAYRGALYWMKDALGRQTTAYDWKRGKPQRVRRADNTNTYQTIDNNGWVMSQKDAMGRTTTYTRDNMGRLTLINPHGSWANTSINYNFNGGGAIQTITTGQSKETITYDKLYRPILERTQALDTGWSSYVNTKYDSSFRVKFKSQPSANQYETKGKEFTYDGLGRIYQERENVAPYATVKHRYYSSHRHRIYDPSGAFTQYYSYGYEGPGNKDYRAIYKHDGSRWQQYNYIYKRTYGPMYAMRQWGYDNGYNVKQTQWFYYDSEQRLCRHYVPEQGATKYQYDAAGQMIAYAKGQGNSGCGTVPTVSAQVTQTYDSMGRPRLTNFADPATDDISRTYDANGNLKTVHRGGVNWSYNYNDADLITHEYLDVDGRNYDSIYYYDASKNMTRKRLPSGRNIYYTLDGLGRSKTIKNGSATLASATSYHANGALVGMTYGNGQRFTQTLNTRLLPHRLLSYKGGQKAIDQTYGYDSRGKVTSIIDGAVSGNNRTFGYDGLGRLTTASGPWGSGSYKYDSLDNLRQKKLGSRTLDMTYDSRNRLTRSADTGPRGTRTIAYDAQGNVTTLGNLAFIYDYSDQPVVVSGTANGIGAANGSYTYDGNLKRVKSVVNGKTIYNIYDLSGSLVHIDAVTKNKKTDYVTGPSGSLARITNNVVTYLHPDHLGTAMSTSNSSGTVACRDKYTPFGETVSAISCSEDLAGFTGHIKDKSTGLNYMQARYYDPTIGRFLSVDPQTFTSTGNPALFNRYAYCYDDPVNCSDPDGEFGIIGGLTSVALGMAIRGATGGKIFDAKAMATDAALGAVGAGLASKAVQVARLSKTGLSAGKKLTATTNGRQFKKAGSEGIYLARKGGNSYVGQSGNMAQRSVQSATQRRLGKDAKVKMAVAGGKGSREVAEQGVLNAMGGKRAPGVLNAVNPIGTARQGMMNNPALGNIGTVYAKGTPLGEVAIGAAAALNNNELKSPCDPLPANQC